MPDCELMADAAERNREAAIRRLKLLVPALFGLGFMFFVAITVYPLAGMPASPLQPFGPTGSPLTWLAIACVSGGLFALFGALVVAVSASAERDD
jgi:Na+/proline symporter